MKAFRFEGYSDDTFGEYESTNDDYDNCASGKPIVWQIKAGNEALLVVGQYGMTGNWMIGIANADADDGDDEECKPIPDWGYQIRQGERPYTPALFINAPDNAVLTCVTRELAEAETE